MRTGAVILPFLIMVGLLSFAYQSSDPYQVKGNEICVNYKCQQGDIKLVVAEGDDGQRMMLSMNGNTLTVPVVSELRQSNGVHLFKFEFQRGFLHLNSHSEMAFMFLDGDHVTIHITHSTLSPK